MAVKPIPEGYHTITPYLSVRDASAVISFLQQAFGARESLRMSRPDGSVGHAEVQVGNSMVMLCDETAEWPAQTSILHVYVEDVNAAHARAVAAGGESLMEPADQFYGDRMGAVRDPSGNQWWIATHVEDVPPGEMQRRWETEMAKRSEAPAPAVPA